MSVSDISEIVRDLETKHEEEVERLNKTIFELRQQARTRDAEVEAKAKELCYFMLRQVIDYKQGSSQEIIAALKDENMSLKQNYSNLERRQHNLI